MTRKFNDGIPQVVALDIGGTSGKRLLDSSSYDAFGAQAIYPRTIQIGLKSAHGTSNIRDVITTTGGGSVTNPGPVFSADITVKCDATPNSTARFDTLEWGRYQPSFVCEAIIGVHVNSTDPLVGDQDLRWGYFNTTDGMGFGQDINGIYVFYHGVAETVYKIYQQDWNVDKMDGTGVAKTPLNLSNEHYFIFDYMWAGSMMIEYSIMEYDTTTNTVKKYLVHRVNTGLTDTAINPNVSISAWCTNGTTSAPTPSVNVSTRSYSVLGEYNPHVRYTSTHSPDTVALNSTTWTPIMSIRKKSTHTAIGVKFDGYDLLTSAGDVEILVMLNTTLTGGTWVAPTHTDPVTTTIEVNNLATIDGTLATGQGDLLYSSIHSSGNINNKVFGSGSTSTYLGESKHITIMARGIGSAAAVTLVARFTEEW